jgi:hypothetical protein
LPSIIQIAEKLSADFPDCPEDFLLDIAANIESSLQEIFVEEVKECMSTMGQGTSASQLRKRHAELQDKVQGLWNMLHLFQKAIGLFQDDAAVQMNRYLLRTLCTDIFNHVLKYLADDNGVNLPSGNEFSLKERSSIVDALPASMKKKVTAVNAVLSGKVCMYTKHVLSREYELNIKYRNTCMHKKRGTVLPHK